MATTATPKLLASTMVGDVVVMDGIVYLLTRCCGASAKGSANSPTGVCCRACYAPLPESAGWAAMVDDEDGPARLAELLRPSVAQYAEKVAADVFAQSRTEVSA